jgi:hypothetical protein
VKELLAAEADIERITKQLADPSRTCPTWRLKARSALRHAQRKRLDLIAATRTERERRDENEGKLAAALALKYWPAR